MPSPLRVGTSLLGSGGRLMMSAPDHITLGAPPLTPIEEHRGRLFNPPTWKYHVNDQADLFLADDRDWAGTVSSATTGFLGWRNEMTWMRDDAYYGKWDTAERYVTRIYRKGTTGVDLRILVLECSANIGLIPQTGTEKVVLWQVAGYDGGVSPNTTYNLSGYNLPLRQKVSVVGSTASAPGDAAGVSTIHIGMGVDLPAIDTSFAPNTLRVRHWSFYRNTTDKIARIQCNAFVTRAKQVIAANGHVVSGGQRNWPFWRDWTQEYQDFGSMVEELWRGEQEFLANSFDDVDPRKIMFELESAPTRNWTDGSEGVGYGTLLRDVWYPIAREYHPEGTLGVKSTSFGGLDSLITEFDWVVPDNRNTFILAQNFDGEAHYADGSAINWSGTDICNWYIDQLKGAATAAGAHGAGVTRIGQRKVETWNGNATVTSLTQGTRLGRILTAAHNRAVPMWVWGRTYDEFNVVDLTGTPDTARIEEFQATVKDGARIAGLVT